MFPWAVLITGAFGIGGVLGGVLLGAHFTRRTEQRRVANEDDRRWLADRRQVYARYLGLIGSMLKDIDGYSSFLSHDGTEPITKEDEAILVEEVRDFYARWDEELQPVLAEVQLLSSPAVAELADRTSWGLMELNGLTEARQTFQVVTEYGFKTRHLIEATRNGMRAELGLTAPVKTFPIPDDWPWLPE
jgi:hypothetical protein